MRAHPPLPCASGGTGDAGDAGAAAADAALAEVQQQLRQLYVQRRLQALHPRVDAYLAALALPPHSPPHPSASSSAATLATTLAATLASAVPAAPVPAAARVSGAALHVLHGLLAVQLEVEALQPACVPALLPPCVEALLGLLRYTCDATEANVVTCRVSGGRDRSRGPFRDARRCPSTRWYSVPGAARTTLGFGMRPSFKRHFLSRRALTLIVTVRHLLHRCVSSGRSAARRCSARPAGSAMRRRAVNWRWTWRACPV
jgi:hypothetical protein